MISLSPRAIAKLLIGDPDRCAMVLLWLAAKGDGVFREELSHHLQTILSKPGRAAIRDLALMIAGACGEAE